MWLILLTYTSILIQKVISESTLRTPKSCELIVLAEHIGVSPDVQKIIEDFAPLIRPIARRMYIPPSFAIGVEDLEAAGLRGLLSAAQSYDQSKGASVKTHVFRRIKGAMLDILRDRNSTSFPRTAIDHYKRHEQMVKTYHAQFGREPTTNEMAYRIERGDWPMSQQLVLYVPDKAILAKISDVESYKALSSRQLVLEETNAQNPTDQIAQIENAQEAAKIVGGLLAQLSLRERQVVEATVLGSESVADYAQRMGTSYSAIANVKNSAIKKLRKLSSTSTEVPRSSR